ncbi:TPA: hypothetical protein HH167_004899 [Escherichia coli]|nr:hypothetical protein [Escherichia coli]HAH4747572.1 hypothetical protein [Escherichia coli]HAH4923685.1 hypothetical protein [Escherichia coli]HAH4929502.1 hypothetical protein [Escherichia coli]HAH4976729.1 hypothetical protein [Escherichia coli]
MDHVNDTQVTKPARIIGARRTELLSSHTGRIVFLLYLFFRRLLLNRKITMVIISG